MAVENEKRVLSKAFSTHREETSVVREEILKHLDQLEAYEMAYQNLKINKENEMCDQISNDDASNLIKFLCYEQMQ